MTKTRRVRTTKRRPPLSWTVGQTSDGNVYMSAEFRPDDLRRRWPAVRKELRRLTREFDRRFG